MARGKRDQTYICPACGTERTLTAASHVSTRDFVNQLRGTIQCVKVGCHAWMVRIEEVRRAAG